MEEESQIDFQNLNCFEIKLPTIKTKKNQNFFVLEDQYFDPYSNIYENLVEKIKIFQNEVEEKKILYLIKKEVIPFYFDERPCQMKVVLLRVNSDLEDFLPFFKEKSSKDLQLKDGLLIEISSIDKISEIRKEINKKIDNEKYMEYKTILLFYLESYMNQETFNDTLKLLYEEICNHPKFKHFNFGVLFLVSSNFSFNFCKSQIMIKCVDFKDSKTLFSSFYLRLIKDINFYPLMDLPVLKEFFSQFENYNISFAEAVRKLRILVLFYLRSLSLDSNSTHCRLLSEFTVVSKNDYSIIQTKGEIGELRGIIISSIEIFREILKKHFKIKKSSKIISLLIKKEPFKISEKTDNIMELAQSIAKTIENSEHNKKKEIFESFLEKDLINLKIEENKKIFRDTRTKALLGNINIDSTINAPKKLKEKLEKTLNNFFERFVLKNWENLTEKYSYMSIKAKTYEEFEKIVNPDIIGNIHNAILNKNNETTKVLDIIERSERNFDINYIYSEYIKMRNQGNSKAEDEEARLNFFYSLNELRYLGLIHPKNKSNLMFNKNIFAKAFYMDYSQKIKKK